MDSLRAALADVVGERFVTVDADVLAARATDHTGRYRGRASALVRPADAAAVSAVLGICRGAGVKVTVQADAPASKPARFRNTTTCCCRRNG